MKYTVVLERDEDGLFVATCPAFPGCFTQGKTEKQARDRITALLKQFVALANREGRPLPREVRTLKVIVG